MKMVGSVDAASSEMQVLEEENIELMRENKELRRDLASYRAQVERSQASLSKATIADNSTTKKMFQADGIENKTVNAMNVEKGDVLSTKESSTSKKPIIDELDSSYTPSKQNKRSSNAIAKVPESSEKVATKRTKSKVVAKPLDTAAASLSSTIATGSEEPGECNQS